MRVAVDLGVRTVRLTGGEPLLRRGLPDLVAQLAALTPRPQAAMTTNGLGLDRLAGPLADAGLDRVNVSLDTVDREAFHRLTRRDRLPDVVRGLEAAAAAGLHPVKVNAVAMRGVNDEHVADLLDWCLQRGYRLRLIEQMPLDAQHAWQRDAMVTQAEILERLSERFTLSTPPGQRGSAPAETWLVDGGPATVGVVASVSQPFCGSLRPAAAHRRRAPALVPVRARRGRPARPPAVRGRRRDARRARPAPRVVEARRPRHRRPVLPAAAAPHVRHRRLTHHLPLGQARTRGRRPGRWLTPPSCEQWLPDRACEQPRVASRHEGTAEEGARRRAHRRGELPLPGHEEGPGATGVATRRGTGAAGAGAAAGWCGVRRWGCGGDHGGGLDLAEEAAQGEEVAQVLAVVVAGQPGLAACGLVQRGVVPAQRPGRRGVAAARRAAQPGGRWHVSPCGGAGRPRWRARPARTRRAGRGGCGRRSRPPPRRRGG
nr:radical SAM protein [Angustibacter aerolatus]